VSVRGVWHMGTPLVVWGASGHARVVADIVRLSKEYDIVGFLDDVNAERCGTEFCGARVLGGRERFDDLRRQGVQHVIFGVGDNRARLTLGTLVRAGGFCLATAVHPRATIAADVSVGRGTVVAAGAVINPGARIGENVIINTCACVDHECLVDDGAHVGPGVRLGGKVVVERGAWIGIGATVRDEVVIGAHSTVGAGAVVVANVPARVVAYGVPATVRKAALTDVQG
jgi:UDP-N-acetylbacillosamine N-acetyltransferase